MIESEFLQKLSETPRDWTNYTGELRLFRWVGEVRKCMCPIIAIYDGKVFRGN